MIISFWLAAARRLRSRASAYRVTAASTAALVCGLALMVAACCIAAPISICPLNRLRRVLSPLLPLRARVVMALRNVLMSSPRA